MTADLIAQKRAEIAAKIAAMKKNVPTASSRSVPASSVATPSPTSTPAPASTSHSGTPDSTEELLRRVAEAKRRVAEAQNKLAVKDNPYMVRRDYEMLVLSAHTQLSGPHSGREEEADGGARSTGRRSEDGCSSFIA